MECKMRAAMEVLPVGYRFHPTDEELLRHYLWRKNLGQEDSICVIPELDICRWEPSELPGQFSESSIIQAKDQEWWFFCEQDTGRKAQRSTGGGSWKKTGKTRDVKSRNGKQVIGHKRILPFQPRNSSNGTATDWVMHEYLLPSNALDGLVLDKRKNYVLCMIKRNSDEQANSSPTQEFGWDEPMNIDISSILELEADNGFIPEHLIQSRMKLLEAQCRTPDHGVNPNLQHRLAQFPEHFTSSADSSHTQFSFGRESMELNMPFSSEASDAFTDVLNQVFVDEDEHLAGYEIETSLNRRDDDIFETFRPQEQQTFVMESKQTQKVESFHGFVPIDEKKGIVEDDLEESTASSVQVKAPQVMTEKETSNTISYVPTEAKTQKHAPTTIKEEIISACSSSTSIHKSRKAAIHLERHANPANTTKVKEITSIPALNEREKAAREKEQVAKIKPVSSSSSAHSCRKCSCNGPSSVDMWNELAGIIVLIAIFFGIFILSI